MLRKSVPAGFIVEKTPEKVAITRPHMSAERSTSSVSTTISDVFVAEMSP